MVEEFRRSLPLNGKLRFSRLIELHCRREFVFDPQVYGPLGGVVDPNADLSWIADSESFVEFTGELKAFWKPSAGKIIGHRGGN